MSVGAVSPASGALLAQLQQLHIGIGMTGSPEISWGQRLLIPLHPLDMGVKSIVSMLRSERRVMQTGSGFVYALLCLE
jgi:hypothetical protein